MSSIEKAWEHMPQFLAERSVDAAEIRDGIDTAKRSFNGTEFARFASLIEILEERTSELHRRILAAKVLVELQMQEVSK